MTRRSNSLSEKAPVRPERRCDSRQLTILRVGILVVGRGRELCLLRNMSASGLMVHTDSRFSEGQRLAVELRAENPIAGTVIWIHGSNMGIGFDAPIDVEEMLAIQSVPGKEWQPRPPRIEVDLLGTLRVGFQRLELAVQAGELRLPVLQLVERGHQVVVLPQDLVGQGVAVVVALAGADVPRGGAGQPRCAAGQ